MNESDILKDWKTRADVKRTFDAVLCGKMCVQVWLGFANVLFIGFGDEVLPPTPKGENHVKPPYEIETRYADWWIQEHHNILETSNSEKYTAQAAAEKLVGKKVLNWYFFNKTPALRIDFEEGLELRMAPYIDGEDTQKKRAWVLRGHIYYGNMSWDGTIGNGRIDHYFVDSV